MDFPKLVFAACDIEKTDLEGVIASNRQNFEAQLLENGALLFRGFQVESPSHFESISAAGTPGLVAYTGGGSPRKQVEGRVYNSTEYPKDQPIPLHCEESYFPNPPRNIWFFCERPASEQGQTPLGNMHTFLDVIDPSILETFVNKGVRYIYNLHGGSGFGRGWKDAFQTDDREWVTEWLENSKADYKWCDDAALKMDLLGPALRQHSRKDVQVWGNQVVNWHVDALPAAMARSMRRVYKSEDDFPKHATYGDGTPIPTSVIEHILESLRSIETVFDWQQGDVLWCDNEIIAHGRRPFKGDRSTLVALA